MSLPHHLPNAVRTALAASLIALMGTTSAAFAQNAPAAPANQADLQALQDQLHQLEAKINALQAKSAKAEAKRLQKDVFPEYRIGLLHGGVVPNEKDEVMKRFAAHDIDILVATSVVEVGINVPNATVILIEGAERFGLSQLHQLRGRIMRSSSKPFCFLLPESKSEVSMKRLRALAATDDGFKLAEADLEARGAGDLYGRKQWGVTDLGMEALKNMKLIRAARIEAQALVARNPLLSNYPALAERVKDSRHELHGE